MVEVYRTNVATQKQAKFVLEQLLKIFPEYLINFDLEDCDNILRVESVSGKIEVVRIAALLNDIGFFAMVLPDTIEV
ncbi:hypothetical protein LCGC14_0993210 [marine sediment metagenome]|uniref:Uncharacterized protein n=2 Tax=root TaxID=1 RepID=A0A831VM87_9FLAO|nr:hypothetical protein [Pricia sp.]HEA19501.1 hypothetical protein [Pricia antarctica]